jgi:sugar-specific transcriptional regulator TrmB
MQNLIKNLKNIGLKQNEAEIYLYLLQNGLSTPPQIAKGTGIFRTNCYNILQTLKEKDILEEQKRGKKKVYLARDPESLKLNLSRKIESIDFILPDLRGLYKTQKNKPLIRFFDGWGEVKNIYDMTLNTESLYATGSTEKLQKIDPIYFEKYFKILEKNKVMVRDLLSPSSKNKSVKTIREIRNSLHQIKFIPERFEETETDILVWDDNVALISLDEPIFGTVITNPPLAKTITTLIKVIWEFI